MVFWIAILSGVLFIWVAVRLRFYATWVLLFNILVSIYVSIFLAPIVAEFAPAPGGAASYGMALSMLVLAGGCFAILHGLSYVFLTGQFNIPFPAVFDIVLSGLLGFIAGFLVLSFVAIILTTTPLAQHEMVSSLGLNEQSQQSNIACLVRCCNLIHSLTAFEGKKNTMEAAIHHLMDGGKSSRSKLRAVEPDANEPPAKPAKPPPRESTARRKISVPMLDAP
ncbi:MAG: CvpA family protein [Sedimentisphaerales bacterium]|nr:CvpA family protein [Sedimentisphaerales bacterium]